MMLKTTNLKALWIVIAIFGLGMAAQAQTGKVGVNTDTPATTLHVHQGADYDGIIAPQVTGEYLHGKTYKNMHNAAIVYVTEKPTTSPITNTQVEYVTEKGYYYFDATAASNAGRWMRLVIGNPIKDNKVNWFYMPSVSIDASSTGAKQINLYDQYTNQFKDVPATQNSTGAVSSVPVLAANQLDYYVVDVPASITITGISTSGVMSYTVNTAATPCDYINIVFVIK